MRVARRVIVSLPLPPLRAGTRAASRKKCECWRLHARPGREAGPHLGERRKQPEETHSAPVNGCAESPTRACISSPGRLACQIGPFKLRQDSNTHGRFITSGGSCSSYLPLAVASGAFDVYSCRPKRDLRQSCERSASCPHVTGQRVRPRRRRCSQSPRSRRFSYPYPGMHKEAPRPRTVGLCNYPSAPSRRLPYAL